MTVPMSWFNRIALTVFALGTIWSAAHRVWYLSALLAIGTAYAVWAIRYATGERAGDVHRLDAAQPVDERDRLLLARSLAVVGGFAVLAEITILAWRLGGGYDDDWGSTVRLPVLSAVWLVANRIIARRPTSDA